MSRTQPKSSPTDEHARRIAQAIAKGRPPPFNDAFDRYCESSPREIFAAFTGAARHMPPLWEEPCTSRKSRHRLNLPRRRQGSPSIATRTDRFRPTSTPLSPASWKPATAIRS
jgi:hypothetical protein